MKSKKELYEERNFRVITNNRKRANEIQISLTDRELPVLSPADQNELDETIDYYKELAHNFPKNSYENTLMFLKTSYHTILSKTETANENGKPWLAVLMGYYGILEICKYLGNDLSSAIQVLLFDLRDNILQIIERQDESFFADFAAFILKHKKDYYSDIYATETEEIISSLIINRPIESKYSAQIIQIFLDREIEHYLQKYNKRESYRTQDTIGRLYSIKLDIMFNMKEDRDKIFDFYFEHSDYPFISNLYFSNLYRTKDYTRIYTDLMKVREELKDRFDSYAISSERTEYSHILLALLKNMILDDTVQPYTEEFFIDYLTGAYKLEDLKDLLLLYQEYHQDFDSILRSVYKSDQISNITKAEIASSLKDLKKLLTFSLEDPELFELYYDYLYREFPQEVQDQLISKHYLMLPEEATTRSQYKRLIEALEVLDKDFKENSRSKEVASIWREKYSRKRALIDELEKSGY